VQEILFASSEATDAERRPRLTVRYRGSPPAPAPDLAQVARAAREEAEAVLAAGPSALDRLRDLQLKARGEAIPDNPTLRIALERDDPELERFLAYCQALAVDPTLPGAFLERARLGLNLYNTYQSTLGAGDLRTLMRTELLRGFDQPPDPTRKFLGEQVALLLGRLYRSERRWASVDSSLSLLPEAYRAHGAPDRLPEEAITWSREVLAARAAGYGVAKLIVYAEEQWGESPLTQELLAELLPTLREMPLDSHWARQGFSRALETLAERDPDDPELEALRARLDE
jgi:hypothetical protein